MRARAALPAAMLVALACALPGAPALAQDQAEESSSDAPPKPTEPTHTPAESPPPPADDPNETPPPPAGPTLSKRPRLLESVTPKYPPEAWAQDVEGDVTLLLWVDEQGRVEAAEVVSTPGFGLETAALVAAKQLRFTPAEMDGEPVKVKIRYTFRFRKPEKSIQAEPPKPGELCPEDTRKKAKFIAHVKQRGTGKPLVGAEVYLLDLDEAVLTDDQGRLEKELPPGGYALTIRVPGHHAHESLQRLEPAEQVEVELFIEPRRRGKYQTIVWGSEDESLVGRTTLEDDEIY
jgi:TonB family protein